MFYLNLIDYRDMDDPKLPSEYFEVGGEVTKIGRINLLF